mmetsp:Transcript_60992/g.133481  ORF Transcript_60992/g.133481 Transcript_60992/m.133481 type:complete len:231 (+) Transcript_60992:182-874(+)|eukprot:CAMPEP_0206465898 /NCGR_PEP_ID=MMETSP0324_2-20121206/28121_1 /ASSEMBLY_ACC=CAM_ASM_000836 /TAXON_ID=2866 /ORGANISM="Crypthecodinium cohnii, Strain Seligo" /LENGTH=230 /DNA_ID=CAMNT_0053938879 /DNA_START=166 /DNA_END=858 /DNA_ORIENTATION=+
MPLIVPKPGVEPKLGEKLTADAELYMVCGWGKCPKRLERALQKKPDVNYKNPGDGLTPMHQAAMCGSAAFCKRLIEAKADVNVPATDALFTPLEFVLAKIAFEEDRDRRLNNFDTVNRLDDTCLAIRPDLKPYKEVKAVLEEAGAVCCNAYDREPTIKPDGSISGGAPSELRAYKAGPDGSYTAAAHLRTGKYDALKYEDGRLVECEYDPKTGKWAGFEDRSSIVAKSGA